LAVGQKWTDVGQAFAVDQLDKNTAVAAASFSYFGAWGSGSTTPAVGDTALVSENPESRTSIPAGSMSQPAADTVRWTYVIVATGSRTVQETGIFSASTAGNMYIRIVHGSLALESGDQVTYTVNLRLKDDSEA
jgi:hypothetical protein